MESRAFIISPSHWVLGVSDSANISCVLTIHRWRQSQNIPWNRRSFENLKDPPLIPALCTPAPLLIGVTTIYFTCIVHDAAPLSSTSPNSREHSFIYWASGFLRAPAVESPCLSGRSYSPTWLTCCHSWELLCFRALGFLPALHSQNMLVFILFILGLSVSVISWLFLFSSSDALRESLWSMDSKSRHDEQICKTVLLLQKCVSETKWDSSLTKENQKKKKNEKKKSCEGLGHKGRMKTMLMKPPIFIQGRGSRYNLMLRRGYSFHILFWPNSLPWILLKPWSVLSFYLCHLKDPGFQAINYLTELCKLLKIYR